MDIKLNKKPTFSKNNVITLDLTEGNRVYGRAESLQHCLYATGYHYEIDITMKPDSKKIFLKPEDASKIIRDCNQLESILESCGFQMKIKEA